MAFVSVACPVCNQKNELNQKSKKFTCLHCGAKLRIDAMPTASVQMASGWRSATAGGTGKAPQEVKVSIIKPSTQSRVGWRNATAGKQFFSKRKSAPAAEARIQPKIGWKYATAGAEKQSVSVNATAPSRPTTNPNVISIKNPTSKQPQATTATAASNTPSSGKAFGFGFLCYAIMATLMTFTSVGIFQGMGYSAYIGPNLITLALAIIFGLRYKSTGNALAPLVLALVIGIALGLALPHLGVYLMDIRYGK